MVIYLERGADLHMAELMPLPLTVSCFSEIQIGFTFLVPAHPGGPGQRAVKRVCVLSAVHTHARASSCCATRCCARDSSSITRCVSMVAFTHVIIMSVIYSAPITKWT